MLAKTNISTDAKYDVKFIHTFLLYTGAFLFSIIMIVLVHEFGHFLAYRLRGYEMVSIRINPFMGATSTPQAIQPKDFEIIALGGTIFNLSLALLVSFLLRFTKNPYLLPARMYPATAFLIEGVVIVAGLFFQETITDFSWLIFLGWNPAWVVILGVLFVIIGGYLTNEVWMLLGLDSHNLRRRLFVLNVPFLFYGLVGFILGQAISIDMEFFKKFILACTLLHWSYLGIRILVYPLIVPYMPKKLIGPLPKLTPGSSMFSLILGCTAWMLSFIVLN